MVIESLRIVEKRGLENAAVESVSELTGSPEVSFVVIDIEAEGIEVDREDGAFRSLALKAFASDWESAEDSVFDSLLSDAQPK